jgi:hypothetical protein
MTRPWLNIGIKFKFNLVAKFSVKTQWLKFG